MSDKMKLLFLILCVTIASGDRIVKTTNGPVKGTSLSPKKVEAFLGIPYAEPPVGPLRFAKPVPKSSWDDTYKADKLPPMCIQKRVGKLDSGKFPFTPDPDDEMNEDCLYLNLWVPENRNDLKPIMLFIHGGGFMLGSSSIKIYNGANLAEHGGVIVATINYRLGTLGFFCGFTEDALGSMGMYDQVMAIQWIKDNAKHFGGDPDNIVLFGESAGGFAVSMHVISPLSKGLFRRAILQSGTSVNPLLINNKGLFGMSEMIAGLLGCADESDSLQKNPKGVIDCMKALPQEKFAETDGIFIEKGGMLIPRTGNSFLPDSTIDSLKKGNFKDTELLVGVTRDEGSISLAFYVSDQLGVFGEKWGTGEFNKTIAKQFFDGMSTVMGFDVDYEIIEKYFDRVKKEPEYTYLKATSDFIGDLMVTCSSVFQADYHSLKDNPVYFYVFDYRPDSTPLAEWMGVAHFDEMQYVFGNPAHQEFTEYESEFSRHIMDMWVAFAKTGNPNIPGRVKWPRYTYEDPKYLAIGKKDRVGISPDNHRCEFWRNIFQTVIDEDTIERLKKLT